MKDFDKSSRALSLWKPFLFVNIFFYIWRKFQAFTTLREKAFGLHSGWKLIFVKCRSMLHLLLDGMDLNKCMKSTFSSPLKHAECGVVHAFEKKYLEVSNALHMVPETICRASCCILCLRWAALTYKQYLKWGLSNFVFKAMNNLRVKQENDCLMPNWIW